MYVEIVLTYTYAAILVVLPITLAGIAIWNEVKK